MLMNKHDSIATLLVIAGLLLGSLIPGGPIETRDFSHISPLVLGLFNLFLTALGLGSFVVAFLLYRGRNLGLLALWMGVSYLVVYVIDLLGIFPKTISEMPIALFSIEVAGSVIALPIMMLGYLLSQSSEQGEAPTVLTMSKGLMVVLGLLSACILVFATLAAMGV